MKKYVRHFIILSIFIFVGGSAYGQGSSIAGAVASVASGITEWSHRFNSLPALPRPVVEGADLSISYYDPLLPSLELGAPVQVGSYIVPTYGERITLPGMGGYLDSVQVTLDTITADSVLVYLIPDTLYETTAGMFHLMNIFDPNAQTYEVGYIHPADVHGRTTITLPVAQAQINAQNFWIAIEPNFDQSAESFTSAYRLIGDSESIQPRSTDGSHSGFLALLNTGQSISAVFDSTFINASGDPIFSNFYITAFVSNAPLSVANNQVYPTIAVFPNPSSSFIQIQNVLGVYTVEILDLLGRSVLSSQLNGSSKLDVSHLQPGRYEAVVHSASGVTTAPVIIQR